MVCFSYICVLSLSVSLALSATVSHSLGPLSLHLSHTFSLFHRSLEPHHQHGDTNQNQYIGGYVSSLYTLKYKQSVDKLILVSPFGVPESPIEPPERAPKVVSLMDSIWRNKLSPQDIARFLGPYGSDAVEAVLARRFPRLPVKDRDALAKYTHHIWVNEASGEYALHSMFHPFGYAKSPLGGRLLHLQTPTYFIYGEYDWMDWRHASKLVRLGTNENLKEVFVLPSCGHQLFLENPKAFVQCTIDVATRVEEEIVE